MKIESFDNYTILANPLPEREQRHFVTDEKRYKVDYGAYWVALAEHNITKSLVILVRHGGGMESWKVESQWIAREPLIYLCAMNERGGYAILFSMYKGMDEACVQSRISTENTYCLAFIEGRLKKRRKNNRVRVEILVNGVAA